MINTTVCGMTRTVRVGIGVVFTLSGVSWVQSAQPTKRRIIADKTLVAWVSPANLTQRGGSALTLENPGGQFDAIVFGELTTSRWMAGSDRFLRTHREQEQWPAERADAGTLVQIAIAYKGKQVAIYRDGKPYAQYVMGSEPVVFSNASGVVMGLRHLDAGGPRLFFGAIDDARVYDTALDAAQLALLRPNEASSPSPLAWWDFESDKAEDRMKVFPAGHLVGKAKIVGGRLELAGGYMVVGIEPPRDRAGPVGKAQLVFEDRFDGKPAGGWTWLRENPEAWRIRDGALEIRVEPGKADTVRNALLRPAPDRNRGTYAFEVTVTSTSEPTQQWEQGGITWYTDGKPVFKLVKELVDGNLMIIPGRKPMTAGSVRFRLIIAGRKWTAQYQPDGRGPFQTAATGELPLPGKDQVSIQCYNGPPEAAHWIRFDDFRILRVSNK